MLASEKRLKGEPADDAKPFRAKKEDSPLPRLKGDRKREGEESPKYRVAHLLAD